MGSLAVHWTFWQKFRWTFTGVAPTVDVAAMEAKRLSYDVLERELQLIDDRHRLEAQKEKIKFIEHWVNE